MAALGDADLRYITKTSSQTYGRRAFDFAAPTADMIFLDDIAVALYRAPRFNGHLDRFWSVGHHSELVATLLEGTPWEFEGLFHDASEAYTGDCPGPFKKLLGEAYKVWERPIEGAIAERFGLSYPWPKEVKRADVLAQDIEATAMLPGGPLPGNIVSEGFELESWHIEAMSRVWRFGGVRRFEELTARFTAMRAANDGSSLAMNA